MGFNLQPIWSLGTSFQQFSSRQIETGIGQFGPNNSYLKANKRELKGMMGQGPILPSMHGTVIPEYYPHEIS